MEQAATTPPTQAGNTINDFRGEGIQVLSPESNRIQQPQPSQRRRIKQ
jgi:hypothetical protein